MVFIFKDRFITLFSTQSPYYTIYVTINPINIIYFVLLLLRIVFISLVIIFFHICDISDNNDNLLFELLRTWQQLSYVNGLLPINLFSIYDGHGGKYISTYLANNLPNYFINPTGCVSDVLRDYEIKNDIGVWEYGSRSVYNNERNFYEGDYHPNLIYSC